MKYTLKMLTAVLTKSPTKALHIQGGHEDTHTVVTCKHPKFDTPLYVAAKGHGKTPPKLTGNKRNALAMTINVAKNIRDNLTENYLGVELIPCT